MRADEEGRVLVRKEGSVARSVNVHRSVRTGGLATDALWCRRSTSKRKICGSEVRESARSERSRGLERNNSGIRRGNVGLGLER